MSGRAHPEYSDYLMSEKFGADWKKYEFKRMDAFMAIIGWENERQNKANKGQKTNTGNKRFR